MTWWRGVLRGGVGVGVRVGRVCEMKMVSWNV